MESAKGNELGRDQLNAVRQAFWAATPESQCGEYMVGLQSLQACLSHHYGIEKPTLEQQQILFNQLPKEVIGGGISWSFDDARVIGSLYQYVQANSESIASELKKAFPRSIIGTSSYGGEDDTMYLTHRLENGHLTLLIAQPVRFASFSEKDATESMESFFHIMCANNSLRVITSLLDDSEKSTAESDNRFYAPFHKGCRRLFSEHRWRYSERLRHENINFLAALIENGDLTVIKRYREDGDLRSFDRDSFKLVGFGKDGVVDYDSAPALTEEEARQQWGDNLIEGSNRRLRLDADGIRPTVWSHVIDGERVEWSR